MAARGGLLQLLDAYIAIGGDATEFDRVVDQSEAKAKKAGGRLESAFSPRRVLGALGAVAGAAFGAALAGANQLDEATRNLAADTGMTAVEAKAAEHAMAGMYRNNLQGFDAIGAAMAKVHNDLGLVGQAADDTTARFLKFAQAVNPKNPDSAPAYVALFDDVLDNWGLTIADLPTVMDKVIVSHHRWGGEIDKNLVTLAKVAPAMRAANFTIDQGIALLGLFGAKGLDSERAAAAFAKALTKVKSPAELQALIEDISATEDPFLRAQKAADLFGAKAGAQLANALGGVNIRDFTVSVDEAAGATDRAAEASLSWGDKATLVFHKIGGALAELGTKFGPLLMVAAAFGPGLTKAIGAGLGGLSGVLIPKVTAAVLATGPGAALAASGVGTTIGAAMGSAIPIALAAGLGLAIGGAIGMAIEGPIVDKAKKDMAASVDKALADAASMADLERMKAVIQKGLDDMPTLLGWDVFGGKDALQKKMDDVDAEIARRAAEFPATVAEEIAAGTPKVLRASKDLGWNVLDGVSAVIPKVEIAVDQLVATFGTSLKGVRTAARAAGADGMIAMAEGVNAARAKPLTAFETLVEMLKHALTPTAEAARLAGELTSKELARGLQSGDPAVRAQAIAVAKAAADRLGELALAGGCAGKKAMAALDAGVRSQLPEVRAASLAAKNAVVANLNATKAPAYTAGSAAAASFVSGMLSRLPAFLRSSVIAQLHKAGVPGYAAGAWEIPSDHLAMVHAREMIVPEVAATAVRAGEAVIAAQGIVPTGAGSGTTNVNVTVQGLVRARDPLEIATQLRRLASFGVLTPKQRIGATS